MRMSRDLFPIFFCSTFCSYSDGMDYCVIRDYMDLQDAAQCMMSEGDGSIRIYVSRDKREPSTVFGEKPRVIEQKMDKDETITEDREEEKESCTTAGNKGKDNKEKEEKEKNTKELESRMNKKKIEQKTIKDKKQDGKVESDSNSSDSDSDGNEEPKEEQKVEVKPVEVSESQKKNTLEKVASTGTISPTPNNPTVIKPAPVFVPPTGEVQMIPTCPPVQPVPYAPYYLPNPNTPVVALGINPWFQYQPSPVQNACVGSTQPNQAGPGSSNYASKSESRNETEKNSIGDDKGEASNDSNTNTDRKNKEEDERMLIELRRISMAPSKFNKSERQMYKNLSLQALRAMGFKQDEAHLKAIIKLTNGDINKVIDLLEYKRSRAKLGDDSPSR